MVVKINYRVSRLVKYLLIPAAFLVIGFVYLYTTEVKTENAAMVAMDHDKNELIEDIQKSKNTVITRGSNDSQKLKELDKIIQNWNKKTFLSPASINVKINDILYSFPMVNSSTHLPDYTVNSDLNIQGVSLILSIHYNQSDIFRQVGKHTGYFPAMHVLGAFGVILILLIGGLIVLDIFQKRSMVDLDLNDALLDNPDLLSQYIHLSSDFQWLVDLHDNYLKLSSNVEKITGYHSSELIGHSLFFIMDRKERRNVADEISKNRKAINEPSQVLKKIIKKNGQYAYLMSFEVPVIKNGKLAGYWGVDRDITDIKINKDRLDYLNELLQAASEIRRYKIDKKNPEKIWEVINEKISFVLNIPVVAIFKCKNEKLNLISAFIEGNLIFDSGHFLKNPNCHLKEFDLFKESDKNLKENPIDKNGLFENILKAEFKKTYCNYQTVLMREENIPEGFIFFASPEPLWLENPHKVIIEDILSDTLVRLHLFNYMQELIETKSSLFQNNQFLRDLLDAIPSSVYWKDNQGKYLGCNRAFCRLAGLEFPEEVFGLSDNDFFWRKDAGSIWEQEKKVIGSGEGSLGFLHRRKSHDGGTLWMNTSIVPLLYDNGNPLGVLGVSTDVTSEINLRDTQVEIKNHLLEKERDLLKAQSISSIGSWTLSINRKPVIVEWSETLYDVLGLKKGTTPRYQKIIEMVPLEEREFVESEISKVIYNYQSFSLEHRIIRPGGEIIFVKHSGEIDISTSGFGRVCCIIQDITEQVKSRELMEKRINELQTARKATLNMMIEAEEHRLLAESALKEAEENRKIAEKALIEAENANLVKSKFLSNMRHEIRTPLNSIMGFSNLLNESLTDETLKGYSRSVINSSNQLLKLIEDIMLFSSSESGDLQQKPVPTDIRQLIYDSRLFFEEKIKSSIIEYNVHIDNKTPPVIVIDEVLLKNAVYHLIDNAIKFSQMGRVDIRLKVKDPGSKKLIIEIEDSGPGISEEDQTNIFKGFYKGKKGSDLGGTGLGLALCSSIIKLLNGKIQIKNNSQKGSIFRIILNDIKISESLPGAKSGVHKKSSGVLIPDLKNMLILVADDNKANRELLRIYLSRTNCHVMEVENGKEAVEFVSKKGPDLVFMDINMPLMGGYEASKIIRKGSSKPKLILLSGDSSGDIDLNEEICDGFLLKPIKADYLYQNICRLFPERQSQKTEGLKKSKSQSTSQTADMSNIDFNKNLHLPKRIVRNLRTLIEQNEENLSFGMDFDILGKFSKDIENLAKNGNVPGMVSWAQKMSRDIESYNISAIELNLRQIRQIAAT